MQHAKNQNPDRQTTGDDSGLIDLRTLAARYADPTGTQGAPEKDPDLIGPAWIPAPVLASDATERMRPSRFGTVLIAALFAIGGVSVAFAAVRIASTSEPTVVGASDADGPEHETKARASWRSVEPEAANDDASDEPPVVEVEDDSAPEPVVVAPRPRRTTRSPSSVSRSEADEAAQPAHSWDTGGEGDAVLERDLDTLLNEALGGRPSPSPDADRPLPDTPTARQVQTTLRALEGEIAQCSDAGSATVDIVIAGESGRVTSATASGEASSCVERVVRTARFPRFARERFTVRYPFRW